MKKDKPKKKRKKKRNKVTLTLTREELAILKDALCDTVDSAMEDISDYKYDSVSLRHAADVMDLSDRINRIK